MGKMEHHEIVERLLLVFVVKVPSMMVSELKCFNRLRTGVNGGEEDWLTR